MISAFKVIDTLNTYVDEVISTAETIIEEKEKYLDESEAETLQLAYDRLAVVYEVIYRLAVHADYDKTVLYKLVDTLATYTKLLDKEIGDRWTLRREKWEREAQDVRLMFQETPEE